MSNHKWANDDKWNFQNLTRQEIYDIYGDKDKNNLRNIINYYKKKPKMERDTPYINPETEKRRRQAAPKIGNMVMTTLEVPIEHLAYHERLQEGLNEHGTVSKATFTDWELGYVSKKEQRGPITLSEASTIPLQSTKFEVTFEHEPSWDLVTRIESQNLPKKESKKGPADSKVAVILPDFQIPYSSPEAIDIALQIVRDTKPDKIILLGDLLDLAAFGKYQQRPEFAQQTQGAIVEAHQLLAMLRKLVPAAQIIVQEANHDRRLPDMLIANAQAAYGLKRADQLNGWPVMSVPFLCAFDQLDIEYNAGYPSNRVWINERLQVIHGAISRPGGKSANAILQNERVSTIFGHTHRIESSFKTVNVFDGGRTNASFNIGCLCRIDGSVPSAKSGFDLDGKPVANYMDWANGLAVVQYFDGDNSFNVEQLYINTFSNYETIYRGKIYRPRERES